MEPYFDVNPVPTTAATAVFTFFKGCIDSTGTFWIWPNGWEAVVAVGTRVSETSTLTAVTGAGVEEMDVGL